MRDPDVCPWSWWVKGKGIEKGKGSVCSGGRWLQEVGGVGQLPTSGDVGLAGMFLSLGGRRLRAVIVTSSSSSREASLLSAPAWRGRGSGPGSTLVLNGVTVQRGTTKGVRAGAGR